MTSSPVVSSSAISRRGSQASAKAIITRWAHAAGHSMPVPSQPARRIRYLDTFDETARFVQHFTRRASAMQDDDLGYLGADGQDRVERRYRFLKDHRDFVAAGPSKGSIIGMHQVYCFTGTALSVHTARYPSAFALDQAHHRQGLTLLPDPDSPTIASVSPSAWAKLSLRTASIRPLVSNITLRSRRLSSDPPLIRRPAPVRGK